MSRGGVDVTQRVSVGCPVIERAPALGVVLGERVIEGGGTGAGKSVLGAQPLLAQPVELVEGIAKNSELIPPAVLHHGLGQGAELYVGGCQQVVRVGADVLERPGRFGVAPALAQPVGVVIVRPAVEVGVFLGVGVPFGENPAAVADEAVDLLEGPSVGGVVKGDGAEILSGLAASGRPVGAGRRRSGRGCRRWTAAGGAHLRSDGLQPVGVCLDYLLGAEGARLLYGTVMSGAVVHRALQGRGFGERLEESGDEGLGDR
ncbi:hypothetical protein [Streptomyces sp. NPDC026589]|uniref:hypothetical protein n=1 Tax=Streptomyces sp. NPDC026589 TaxID=3155609 RepID=UPI0033ECB91D